MYESMVLQKLNTLLSEKEDAAMLLPESSSHISDYQDLLKEYLDTTDFDAKSSIEERILKMFSVKKKDWQYIEDGEPVIPAYKLLRQKIGTDLLSNSRYISLLCERLRQKAYQWRMLIERTQQTLKGEKFKPDLNPIVTLSSTKKQIENNKIEEVDSAVVIIINNQSFVRLEISHEKVEQRIQRAIRKDIIDVLLKDKQLSLVFHSIREQVIIDLDSYKEARALQEAIHAIRNTPFFTRPINR